MSSCSFDPNPVIQIHEMRDDIDVEYKAIISRILNHSEGDVAIETYHGVDIDGLISILADYDDFKLVDTRKLMKDPEDIRQMIFPDVTDDRVFGYLTRLTIRDYFPLNKTLGPPDLGSRRVIIGPGALCFLPRAKTRVYADMPRWEIQMRQRQGLVDGLGTHNCDAGAKHLYKQGFFVDWRVLDKHKKDVFPTCHFYLDTVDPESPKMVSMRDMLAAMEEVSHRPFALKPFFDPGIWGGTWMKDVLGIEGDVPNYAWCFNCVPEENSMLLGFDNCVVEVPSINLVFFETIKLLGNPVYSRFGDEFPIRFDFLDTMGGQNLSFQVHPRTEYIQEKFGMHYTQDESYYILDAGDNAIVYLGLNDGIDPEAMKTDLQDAQDGTKSFDDKTFVKTWPVKKHDHFLIPAGTVHCSGAESMVLEISATPYIFTFKLWDWDRLDLDGLPRPINLDHGFSNIDWHRTAEWVGKNLVNRTETVAQGPGWIEERTGLHETEFIETRRHWFSVPVLHDTGGSSVGSVHVLNLVEGQEALVESPTSDFRPFVVHYAETFILPASIGKYTIRPSGLSEGKTIATIRASIRQNAGGEHHD